MRRTILMLGLAWSLSFPAAAHQCVLEGSTSEAIQSYNACKLDLATGQSGHFLSRHYDDLGQLWRRGEYIPMSLDLDLARAAAVGVTQITPE